MNENQMLEEYYQQNAKKLHQVVDKILIRFGGISQKDEDDFYSLANEVFVDVLRRYDGEQNFHAFLYFCLVNRMKSEVTKRNREKRKMDREAISIDMPIGENNETIADLLPADFDMEKETALGNNGEIEENVWNYLSGLSVLQRKILELRMEDYTKHDILERLGISEHVYNRNLGQLKSREKTKVLYQDRTDRGHICNTNKGEEKNMNDTQTSEISKETMYTVSSIIRKTENGSIRDDHSLQRQADQWNNKTKGDFIVTILHRYPIPAIIIAEQVSEGFVVNWLIDGKQRCTTCCVFAENGFKISKNAERPIVTYQSMRREANGTIHYETKECDVRGKYFRDLPEELRERFYDYTIPIVMYLNCSDDDIEYHIRRYNAAKPMSVAQKGITHLGEPYAKCVKMIAEKPFFKDMGNYRICEFVNGTMDRVVTESIMTLYFLPDWKKKNEDICAYLKEHASMEEFEGFAEIVDRLASVVTRDVKSLFQSRDSFLWFGLFGRFMKTGKEDAEFILFMQEFQTSLHEKAIHGVCFDSLNEKSTKDKRIVIQKLDLLECLMLEFLTGKKGQSA